ncbi:hypothetical protein [Streptomyces ziwulingensis]|uniref:Uncharacterized protein n=1 Tax=Streptomyces ziwulingensis TaxID=1045501 RepID=A0ABP9BGU6_9ACTN
MTDVTRPTGGTPAERGHHTPTPGVTPLDSDAALDPDAPLGARADHAAGTRAETTPHLRTEGTGSTGRTDGIADTSHTSDTSHPDGTGTGIGTGTGTGTGTAEHAEHAATATPTPTPGLGSTPTTAAAPSASSASSATSSSSGTSLLAHEESDKFGERLHHAVAGFVDGPRASVEEADRVLEELASRFTDAVTKRRHTLRTSWQSTDAGEKHSAADTEQLRLALRDYRELSDRLLRL